uniref:Myotubularin related protein 14 n=1 Tax=Ascaris lumbricoides TaxID=6252 RepID=A0A0M3IXQ4_ASCLU
MEDVDFVKRTLCAELDPQQASASFQKIFEEAFSGAWSTKTNCHLPGLYLESEKQSAQYSSPDIVTFRDSILSKDIVHLWLSTFKLSEELCENGTKDPKGL